MHREFRLQDGKSDKFWSITVTGSSHTVHFGRAGTNGQRRSKDHDSEAAAAVAAARLIASKVKKGYAEVEGAEVKEAKGPSVTAPALAESAQPKDEPPPAPAKIGESDPLAAIADFPPEVWRLSGRRGLAPVPRGKPKPFKRERALKTLRKLQKNYAEDLHHVPKLWGKAIPTALSREEAEFWWQALRRLKRGEGPNSVAESLERLTSDAVSPQDLEESLVATPSAHELSWLGTVAGPDGTLRVLPALIEPQGLIDLLVRRFKEAGIWIKAGAELWETLRFVEAFGRRVLPYLPLDVVDALRARLSADLDPKRYWPTGNLSAGSGVAWYLAGLIGCGDPQLAVVEDWHAGRYPGDDRRGPLWILLGLSDPTRAVAEATRFSLRPSSPFELEAWMAVTGEDGLEIASEAVLDQPSYMGTDLAKVFARYRTPAAVDAMLRIRAKRPTAKLAGKWFKDHPDLAARGFLRLVVEEGDGAEEAVDRLLTIKCEQADVFEAAVAAESPSAEVLAALSGGDLGDRLPLTALSPRLQERFAAVAALPAAPAKQVADWLSLRRLSPVSVGGVPLDLAALALIVRAIQAAPLEVRPDGPGPDLLAALAEEADEESREQFGWELFQGWLRNGTQPDHKWCVSGLGYLGGDRIVRELTPLIRNWPGESQHQRAVLGLDVLRQIGSDAALGAIAGIAGKLKYRGLKARAAECMDLIAAGRGMNREELADRLVPECGLDAGGQRVFDYGTRRFEFVLGPELKPMVRNEADKLLKSPPKPGKKDDPELAPAAYADWKVFRKQVADALKLQVLRLELAMVWGRRWSREEFKKLFVEHPLLAPLVRSLLWAAFPPQGAPLLTFRVDSEGAFLNVEGAPVEVGESRVGLVHPLHLTPAERTRWDALWDGFEVLAPFSQLDREVYTLEGEALRANVLDTGLVVMTPQTLRSAMLGAGWQRGEAQDAGLVNEHVKHFEAANVTAILQHEGISVAGYDGWDRAEVERCLFLRGVVGLWDCTWVTPEAGLALGEVDPVVLSEVLRDLSRLAPAEA
ncbi:MAG: DUF4132 domain-containing protein [Planctomycetes bacterium]|nr:DUF4132 domain-containing protein [Planctomycetota bacterium]